MEEVKAEHQKEVNLLQSRVNTLEKNKAALEERNNKLQEKNKNLAKEKKGNFIFLDAVEVGASFLCVAFESYSRLMFTQNSKAC